MTSAGNAAPPPPLDCCTLLCRAVFTPANPPPPPSPPTPPHLPNQPTQAPVCVFHIGVLKSAHRRAHPAPRRAARRHPQPGDLAHGDAQRRRPPPAQRVPPPPLAPSSSGRPPHKLHTHSLRRAVWHTHTRALLVAVSGTGTVARPHGTRTARSAAAAVRGFPSRLNCTAQMHDPPCTAHLQRYPPTGAACTVACTPARRFPSKHGAHTASRLCI